MIPEHEHSRPEIEGASIEEIREIVGAVRAKAASRPDPVVVGVCEDLLDRSKLGVAKYGVTLARTDLTLRQWLQHALEECYDQSLYLKRAIIALDAQQETR